MKLFKAANAVCYVALIGATIATSASASDLDRKTTVTFSAPVEIPGVHLKGWGVLPAGTYVFKTLDSMADRNIVQIFSQDEKTIYATIMAIPNYRIKATDKTVITFSERPAGQPEALRAWFYPGRQWGEEFVYPKSRAVELARESHTTVLYTPAEVPVEVDEVITATREAPVVVQMRRAPVLAIQSSGDDIQLAQVVTPPPPADMRMSDAARLPKTASDLPLIGMFGLLALAGAFVARRASGNLS